MSQHDRYRPQVHFTPPANWMNDPNGCLYHNGVYHLFYQYHPGSLQWGPMHWGHATSADLLHWTHQPVALFPDPRLGMAFSGSAINDRENVSGLFDDEHGLLAFYTAHRDSPDGQDALQQQCLAVSHDQGQTWRSYDGNPVVPNPGLKDFRDPKVFYHAPSQHWVMVVVAGQQVNFYRSGNLRDWQASGTFGKYQGHDSVVWECPDLVELRDEQGQPHWVLFVSGVTPVDEPFPPMQYFIGQFDGHTFTETQPTSEVNRVDAGADFYAAQSFHGTADHDGRSIWIAWANHWAYANETPADTWRGLMSLPRELSLVTHHDRLCLRQQVVREFTARLSEAVRYTGSGSWALAVPTSAQWFQLTMPVDIASSVRLVLSNNKGDRLCLHWQPDLKTLTLDRTGIASSAFHEQFNQPSVVDLSADVTNERALDICLIVDRCSAEVFALNGQVAMTCQVFPEEPFSQAELTADDGVTLDQAHISR